jgi:hypothetical protein
MFVFLMITMNYYITSKIQQAQKLFIYILAGKNWFSKAVYFPSSRLTGKKYF